MVGGSGRDRVRASAGGDDRLDRPLPAVAHADVEAGLVEAHVATHDAGQLDVADDAVHRVAAVVDPALLHRDAPEAEVAGHPGDLAGVVGLHPADRHERVAALVEGLGDEVLQLAHLVAAEGDPGVAVLALGPDLDPAPEGLAQAGQWVDGRRAEEQRDTGEVVERHRAAAYGRLGATPRPADRGG